MTVFSPVKIGPLQQGHKLYSMMTINLVGEIMSVLGLIFLIQAYRQRARSLTLEHFVTFPDQELPGLSIVIAAKDEEKTLGPALDTLLALDYPDLEIILVEDRSQDKTLQVATQRKQNHPQGHRLRILVIKELPEGWLGKLHALHQGCQASTKPLILLTDADVHFQPGSLKRAVSARQTLDCDHFVAAPRIEAEGFWEPLLVSFFLIMFAVRFQPSVVHRRKRSFVGVGAFNLLTREALEACGYLEPLRLQVTDDIYLGRLIKSQGRRQYCVVAQEGISVKWFEGLKGCILGLEKNGYAGLEYNLPFALTVVASLLVPPLVPIVLTALGHAAWAGAYLLFLFLVGCTIPDSCHLPRWVGLFFPVASLVLAYTFGRSVFLAEKNQGINWRHTHYDLSELRAAHKHFVEDVAPL